MGPFIKLYSGDFDESTAILEKDFADAGASKREAMTAILLTEELFARMAPRSGDCVDAEVKRHWGDVTLRLSSEGDALNPLSDSPFPENDEQDRLRGLLLRANRDKLSYSRRGTRNIVTVSVHLAADKQMKYTLAAMLLGIVFGLACKALLPEAALAFLNGSILGNIRTVFLNALKMMIAPLILFSVLSSVSKLGVPKKLAAFSVPIGSTVNMDGGCFSIVFQGLLLAKMYGVVITPSLLVTTILTAILLSVGAPGVAGSAFICLTTIVVSLGCPAELATFVLGIDSLLSMLRISNNVIGDTAAACAVAAAEKQLDLSVYTGRR